MSDTVSKEVLHNQERLSEHYGRPIPVSVVLEIRAEIDRWLSFYWKDRTKAVNTNVFNYTVDGICERFVQKYFANQAENKVKVEARKKKSVPISTPYIDRPLPILVEEYDWAVSRQQVRRYRRVIEKMLGPAIHAGANN